MKKLIILQFLVTGVFGGLLGGWYGINWKFAVLLILFMIHGFLEYYEAVKKYYENQD